MRSRPSLSPKANCHRLVQKLAKLRLEIPCLSSGCCLKFAENDGEKLSRDCRIYYAASKLGTPYIRILADLEPQPYGEVDDGVVLAALQRLIPVAEEKGVTLLVETNGVYSDTARFADCSTV